MKWYFAAGSPANVTLLLESGVKSILCSFAYFKKGLPENLLKAKRDKGVNVMLDSGAYTNLWKPGTVTIEGYIEYLKTYAKQVTEYVTLDHPRNRGITLRNTATLLNEGFHPQIVDHIHLAWHKECPNFYKSGAKICWGGIRPNIRAYDGLGGKNVTSLWSHITERLKKRQLLCNEGKHTSIHMLAVGQQIRRMMPYFDIVDSFDAATWVKAPQAFGKIMYYYAPTKEKAWPRLSQIDHRELPEQVMARVKELGIDPTDAASRTVMAIKELRRFYKAVEQFHEKAKEKGPDYIMEVSLKKDEVGDEDLFPPDPVRMFVPDLVGGHVTKLLETKSSGEMLGPTISRDEVLTHLNDDFKVRKPFVALVGGLATRGETKGDIDILIRTPDNSPDLVKSIKHRIERALPEEMRKRLRYTVNEGGPFTDYIELFDLTCNRINPHNVVVQMREGDKKTFAAVQIANALGEWEEDDAWAESLWPSMEHDTKELGGAKSIGESALAEGGGKLNPAAFGPSGVRPKDDAATRLKKVDESQIAEMDEKQLYEAHTFLHVEYRKPEHRGDIDKMHALVVDALFEKGFAHPPPPDDGFDEQSKQNEQHAEEQPPHHNCEPRLDAKGDDKAGPPYEGEEEDDETKRGEAVDVSKPFPNEHAARQVDPKNFESFRRGHPEGFPDGVDAIWGITSEGTTALQSLRFAKDKFTPDEAKKWLKDHGFSVKGFEEATGEDESKEPEEETEEKRPSEEVSITQRARDAFPDLCHVCKVEPAAFDIALADQIDSAQSVCLSCLDWRAEHKDVRFDIDILKVDEEKKVMIGIVLEPDEVDAQNDTIRPEIIERAGFNFLADFGKVGGTRLGLMHKKFGDIGLELVMSWIALEDTTINGKPVKKGSWLMGVRATDDSIWQKVKRGDLTGFSIGGVAAIE